MGTLATKTTAKNSFAQQISQSPKRPDTKDTFKWDKPVAKPSRGAPAQSKDNGQTVKRINQHKAIKPAKSNYSAEYNAFVERRRGGK